MSIVAGIYQNFKQLDVLLQKLVVAGYTEDQIEVTLAHQAEPSLFPSGYDPIGGVRLAGSHITTMAATGGNMIGNSHTTDLPLDKLPDLLLSIVNQQSNDDPSHSTIEKRYLVRITTADPHSIEELLINSGGQIVKFAESKEK